VGRTKRNQKKEKKRKKREGREGLTSPGKERAFRGGSISSGNNKHTKKAPEENGLVVHKLQRGVVIGGENDPKRSIKGQESERGVFSRVEPY